jgi:hypothetical protein
MATWDQYKGMYVPDVSTGQAGINLTSDLKLLADRAPFVATADPTASDDGTPDGNGDFFGPGSLWFNSDTRILWVCLDSTTSAAKWRSVWRRVENAIVLAPSGAVTGSDSQALQFDDTGNARGTSAIDFQRTRSENSQVAAGARAAILGGENNTAFTIGSVVAGGKGNNAGGGAGTISNISVGNPTVVTSSGHGLVTGQQIVISNSNSTPNINGTRTVTSTATDEFAVSVNVTGAGNAGNWTTAAIAPYAFVGGGENNKAVGKWSHAEGENTSAVGQRAHAEGRFTTARGSASHAEGSYCAATGSNSHAEGFAALASASYSHAEGANSHATAAGSHTEGRYTAGSGHYSHAEGYNAMSSATAAHAEGYATTASGDSSHAEGWLTTASGYHTHSGGRSSKAHLWAQWARASGAHNDQLGTAQTTITHLFRRTTDATATELSLDGTSPSSSSRFIILDGQTLSCLINIVGRKENGGANDHASFLRQVCIRREGSTTQLVGSVQDVGANINPASWGGVTITADDTNESLKIEVTGAASTDIRWMATVIASEVADAAI